MNSTQQIEWNKIENKIVRNNRMLICRLCHFNIQKKIGRGYGPGESMKFKMMKHFQEKHGDCFINMNNKKEIYLEWNNLTPEQKNEIMNGDGCGHPSNRPKSEIEATKRLWIISITGKVLGWRKL